MSWTTQRPVAFLDNSTPDFIRRTFAAMLKQLGETKLQLISTNDIGKVAVRVFEEPEKYRRKAIFLSGDSLNIEVTNKVFKEVSTDMPLAPGFCLLFSSGWLWIWGRCLIGSWPRDTVVISKLREEFPELEDFRSWLRMSSKFTTKS